MQVLGFSTLFALTYFVFLSWAMPTSVSTHMPRGQVCANDGKTPAGNYFSGRDLAPSSLEHRARDTILWCAPNGRTYVVINLINNIAQTGIMYLLKNAAQDVQARIATNGDGLVQNGVYMFDWKTGAYDCQLYCSNTNNHQQTWGVINAAIGAVWGYMLEKNNIGTATFTIHDGGNEVGQGTIEVVKPRRRIPRGEFLAFQ